MTHPATDERDGLGALLPCPDDLKHLIVSLVVKHFNERGQRELLFTRWKDSIDVQYPTFAMEQFATSLIAAWRCKETNTIWTVQWYPDTPVGSYVLHASTLAAALAAVAPDPTGESK